MAIIWLIIKIILYVLLGILGVCLAVFGVILLMPIYYEAYLEKYDVLYYHFKISTMRWVCARITVEDGEEKSELKIFGKVFRKREVVKTKVKEAKEKVQEKVQDEIDEEIDGEIDEKIQAQNKVESETELEFMGASQEEKQVITRKLAKFILNPLFWPALKAFLVFVKRLIVYLGPKEWSFECVIGKEDHAETGELIAKLTMFYPFYYQHGTIKGNYEKAGVWGGFLAQGRFCLGGILKHIFAFLLNKATRQYIQWFLKYRKEEENGE